MLIKRGFYKIKYVENPWYYKAFRVKEKTLLSQGLYISFGTLIILGCASEHLRI